MQPQSPAAPPPTGPPDNYNFILNPPKASRSATFLSGLNQTQRILLMGVVVVVALMVLVMLFKAVTGGGPNQVALLSSLAERQTEVVRVADLGVQKAQDQNARNLATNVEAAVASERTELINLLADNGVKLGPKQLALLQNSKTDEQLDAAASTGTYDSTFVDVANDQLTNYSSALKQLIQLTPDAGKVRSMLLVDYNSVQLLLKQAQSARQS